MEYKFKGTPAPWVVYKKDTHAGIKTEAPNQLTDIICLDPSPEWHPADIDKWEYDSQLISAAPDLLEACKEALKELEYHNWQNTYSYNRIKTAIHKALKIE